MNERENIERKQEVKSKLGDLYNDVIDLIKYAQQNFDNDDLDKCFAAQDAILEAFKVARANL